MSETNPNLLSDRLVEECKRQQALFSAQPAIVQRFLEVQGKQIAEAIVEGDSQVHFSLPDRIVCTLENVDQPALVTIPQNQRAYLAGSFMNRLRKVELYKQLRHSLAELEQSPDRAVSVATSLLRHAAVMHMVHNLLPAGRSVAYKLADEGETIPFVPEDDLLGAESAITATTDAIAEEGKTEVGRGVCQKILPAPMGGLRRERQFASQVCGRGGSAHQVHAEIHGSAVPGSGPLALHFSG
jgi:hypothetical protein